MDNPRLGSHCRCVNKLVHLGYKQLFFKLNFCHFQLKFELGLNFKLFP